MCEACQHYKRGYEQAKKDALVTIAQGEQCNATSEEIKTVIRNLEPKEERKE